MARKVTDRSDLERPPGSMGFGAQLRARRRELGLSQQATGELSGCSARFVGELERGKATVRLDKVIAVLAALGLELDTRKRKVT